MKKQNWYKLLYQFAIIGILAFMGFRLLFDKAYAPDFEAYCPFGGLRPWEVILPWTHSHVP